MALQFFVDHLKLKSNVGLDSTFTPTNRIDCAVVGNHVLIVVQG
jgi:hypothetical protein